MEIGNFETPVTRASQRQKELAQNACFTCHRAGCLPWKHKEGMVKGVGLSNVGMELPTILLRGMTMMMTRKTSRSFRKKEIHF